MQFSFCILVRVHRFQIIVPSVGVDFMHPKDILMTWYSVTTKCFQIPGEISPTTYKSAEVMKDLLPTKPLQSLFMMLIPFNALFTFLLIRIFHDNWLLMVIAKYSVCSVHGILLPLIEV